MLLYYQEQKLSLLRKAHLGVSHETQCENLTKEMKRMAIPHLTVRVGRKGIAKQHFEYVAREGKASEKKDLVMCWSKNMPDWAKDNPKLFFEMADLYERSNGSTYREIEIALPRELDIWSQLELADRFAEQELGTKYAYVVAVHNPKAQDGGTNPHAHIMFSERVLDGIDRNPEQFFKRYNPKAPEKGGARKEWLVEGSQKDRKEQLKALRLRWQECCNQFLKEHDVDTEIDMRSYKDQGLPLIPTYHLLPSKRGSEEHMALLEFAKAQRELLQTQVDIAVIEEQIEENRNQKHQDFER